MPIALAMSQNKSRTLLRTFKPDAVISYQINRIYDTKSDSSVKFFAFCILLSYPFHKNSTVPMLMLTREKDGLISTTQFSFITVDERPAHPVARFNAWVALWSNFV